MIVSYVGLTEEQLKQIKDATGEEALIIGRDGTEGALLPQADIVMGFGNFSVKQLEMSKKLKWLFVMSAGVEHLAFEALDRAGVAVSNVSGLHATQMAEQALGMMIMFTRQLGTCCRNQSKHLWKRDLAFSELAGKTLCIVGAGNIGRETARKAKAFDMRVTGLKKHAENLPFFDEVCDMSRFGACIAQADFVLLLTPLTPETYHLMDAEAFHRMKQSAVFLNFSRGDTVDEPAMIAALRNGEIGGAALDVTHSEPLEPESPLWDMENVLLTPHIAGVVPDYNDRAVKIFLSSYTAYTRRETLPNQVDLKAGY